LTRRRAKASSCQVKLLAIAGTKGGEKKIPESLGLAPGLVFLLCIIFFQLLHFYDAAAVLDWVSRTFQVSPLEMARSPNQLT
jgi:hypothetical protein